MLPDYYHIKISGNKIVGIQQSDSISIVESETEKKVYNNCKILPSFVDSHCHLHGLGMILTGLLLNTCKSAEECAKLTYQSPSYRGDWIFGLGWNQSLWEDKSYPTKDILDIHFKDVPVFLKRIDAHAAWLNSKALELLNITKDTHSPKGGEILKSADGNPTGILLDEAMFQAEKKIPQFTYEQLRNQVLRSQRELAAVGVTEVHDMDFEPDFLEMFHHLEQNNDLYVKSKAYFRAQNDNFLDYDLDTSANHYFKIVGVKYFLDGALGSHGAALKNTYKDKDSEGLLILNKEEFLQKIKMATGHNLNIAAHAIGDRAVSTALNAYKEISDQFPDLHFRVEHLQLVDKKELHFLSAPNIVASVQPIHYYSDLDNILIQRLNAFQLEGAYLWNTLLQNRVNLLAGSDFPIEHHNPQLGLLAFTNRTTSRGNTLLPNEEISLNSAISAYTTAPRNLFKEKVLEYGARADFIIVDDNDKSQSPFFSIIATYSEGKVIHTV